MSALPKIRNAFCRAKALQMKKGPMESMPCSREATCASSKALPYLFLASSIPSMVRNSVTGNHEIVVYKLYKIYPPVNSGGALVPPHFIDINRGGTGPPCKATSIEWRCTGFF